MVKEHHSSPTKSHKNQTEIKMVTEIDIKIKTPTRVQFNESIKYLFSEIPI